MAFGKPSPFNKNPFQTEGARLVEVPKDPVETHEPRRGPRKYLSNANLTDAITGALSPLMPGAPRPSKKVEVERVREVERAPEAPEATESSAPKPPPLPSWGRNV